MEEHDEQSDSLKIYIRAVRDILENGKNIKYNQYLKLTENFQLTDNEQKRLKELAEQKYEEAIKHYEIGDWDITLKTIEDASIKAPFNRDILTLHMKVLIECIKFSEENNYYITQRAFILDRLKEVDKKVYRQFKLKKEKKFYLKVVIPLLCLGLLTPLILSFRAEDNNHIAPPTNQPINPVGITLEHIFSIDNFNPTIKIINNSVEKFKGTFQYRLSFVMLSDSFNISNIQGTLQLIDRDNNILISSPFHSNSGHRYFSNEEIPISIRINSLREGPDIRKAKLLYETLTIEKEQNRENLTPITVIQPITKKLEIYKYSSKVLDGVGSNYLELELLLHNRSIDEIEDLKVSLEWIDQYKLVVAKKEIYLINQNSVPIQGGSKRFIYRVVELPENITDQLQIRILE